MEHRLQLPDDADSYDTVRAIDAIVAQVEADSGTEWIRVDAGLYQPISHTSWQEQTRGCAEITLSEAALDSCDLLLRERVGISTLAWAEFAPALEAALTVEPDALQRDRLEKALRACR